MAATGEAVRSSLVKISSEAYVARGAIEKYVPFTASLVVEPPLGVSPILLQVAARPNFKNPYFLLPTKQLAAKKRQL